jgi:hypothetical protein
VFHPQEEVLTACCELTAASALKVPRNAKVAGIAGERVCPVAEIQGR